MLFKNSKQLGQIIKEARKKQGVTQQQLALAANVGVRFIVDVEKGKPTSQIEKVITLTNMLGIKLEAKTDEK